jgi:nicotinate-nucleotide adenylyltransferase
VIWFLLENTNWSGKNNRDNMKIGVFGGTFDPPHIGHQILAAEALDQLKLDQVIWVLTPAPPHKTLRKISPLAHRLSMVELAIEGNPKFILSRIEIDRPPPYFAVDTMSLLKEQALSDSFYYLMGLDSLNDLLTWHRPADFVKLCDGIVVMLRQGESSEPDNFDKQISGLDAKLFTLTTPIIDISGTGIRSRVINGEHFRYFVPEKIYLYIVENCLYFD